jgi:hypothetical protein
MRKYLKLYFIVSAVAIVALVVGMFYSISQLQKVNNKLDRLVSVADDVSSTADYAERASNQTGSTGDLHISLHNIELRLNSICSELSATC